MDHHTIRLTPEQTLDAICADFRQYDPQMLLFAEVTRLLEGEDGALVRESGKEGAWVRVKSHRNRQWMQGRALIEHLCATLRAHNPDPRMLAAIAARVFQTRACLEEQPDIGEPCIVIHTGMEAFSCRQCGQCCTVLDYRNEVTAADVARWREKDCGHILEWVGTTRRKDGSTTYQIWVDPATNRVAVPCPFLKKDAAANRKLCSIHDDKPDICRNYPVSRKHARMTGCPGFSK